MTAREIALENEIIRVEVGSTLHGTGNGTGDQDEMGICIPPEAYVIGLKNFEHYEYKSAGTGNRSGPDDLDLIIHSLRKYANLAKGGNPSILEILFAPDERIIHRTDIGMSLLNNADMFFSKQSAARFLGYMKSQRQGLTGEKRSGVPKREDLVAQFGYDTKYAMHAVRLGFQGVEYLRTGRMTLPMTGTSGDICRGIRRGEYTLPFVLEMIDELEYQLLTLRDNKSIPNEPDHEAINTWLVNAHMQWWYRELK